MVDCCVRSLDIHWHRTGDSLGAVDGVVLGAELKDIVGMVLGEALGDSIGFELGV
jgi:hypothetical protein